jgi:hypothetical protein
MADPTGTSVSPAGGIISGAGTIPTGTSVSPAGGIISGAGTILQFMGQMEMGRAARIRGQQAAAMAEFNAWEAQRQAGIAISISQRQAAEERRQATLVASRALAVAAASGAGVSDPTMVRIIANARGEGAVRAATSLYEGAALSRRLRGGGARRGKPTRARASLRRHPRQGGGQPLHEVRHERPGRRRRAHPRPGAGAIQHRQPAIRLGLWRSSSTPPPTSARCRA